MKTILPLGIAALVLLASCSDKSNPSPNPPTQAMPETKPKPGSGVHVNGQVLTAEQLTAFKEKYKAEPKPGNYWYDTVSGLYGAVGEPAFGFMYPGHAFGTLAEDASGGNSGVFINRRQLPQSEWFILSTVLGAAIQPGRYWLDAKGNAGFEGVETPLVNLYLAAAQAAQNRAGGGGGGRGGDNGWSTRFSSGNFNDDNTAGYVSVPGVGVIGSYGY